MAALVLVLSAGTAAATQVDVRPGMIGPSNPLHGLDVAFDNAMMAVGLTSPGQVAYERASELGVLQRKNLTDTPAFNRTMRAMNRVAQRASNKSIKGLQKAEAVLQRVMQRAPAQAQHGLQTALGNIQKAKNRRPSAQQNGPPSQNGAPDSTPGGPSNGQRP